MKNAAARLTLMALAPLIAISGFVGHLHNSYRMAFLLSVFSPDDAE